MAIQVLRYSDAGSDSTGSDTAGSNATGWAVHREGRLAPLPGKFETTRDFFVAGGVEAAFEAKDAPTTLSLDEVVVQSPVTRDADFICQGMNYASHLEEVGREVRDAEHNVFFMKASSCLSPPDVDIVRPAHVEVLDYENELGLVLRRDIEGPIEIDESTLGEFVGGFVLTNDVSAREEQVKAEQFYKAKSYRTFGPTGPFLVLPEEGEIGRWRELVIHTVVNGERRQRCAAGDMVHGPVATLRELAGLRDLRAGDLIATGTPGGVAMKLPGKIPLLVAQLLPKRRRLAWFLRKQAQNPKVLRPGDRLELSIATPDGVIDLGTQRNLIVEAS